MNHDLSNSKSQTSTHLTVPIWIIALMLTLIFLGGVYFDHHSGWFDAKVYGPYQSAGQLAAYQPLSGEAAIVAHGKQVYEINCGTCHGPDGMGMPGKAPPLAGSEWVNAKGFHRLVEIPQLGLNGTITVKGQPMNFPTGMAAVGSAMSDADLAAILTYIRASWGNNADAVTADDVKAVRASVGGHHAIDGDVELKTIPE